MRIGIVGDVHGHRAELEETLARLARHQVDKIVLLGDLVDRGPDSIGCLRVAQHWQFEARNGKDTPLVTVKGNHEDGYVRSHFGVPKPGRTAVEYPGSLQLSNKDIHWLFHLPHYLRIHMEGRDLFLVHGGVLPSMKEETDLDEHILRARYLDQHHQMLRWPQTSNCFWAKVYDGRFGLAVFGHESNKRPWYFPYALGLDGHSYGKIHAAIITDERSGVRISKTFSVDYHAERNQRFHWSQQALF